MPSLPSVFAVDDKTERMSDFGLMPIDDTYLGHIKKSEIKKTKAGTGLRLNMQVEIEESKLNGEDYAGRLVFIGLNIKNPSDQAVAISEKELAAICDAVGLDEVAETEELHDISFGFTLKIEKSEGYDDKNVIKKYMTEKSYDEIKAE